MTGAENHDSPRDQQIQERPTNVDYHTKVASFLKPAVFDSDESTNAPFLLSLSFLLHCHGDNRFMFMS